MKKIIFISIVLISGFIIFFILKAVLPEFPPFIIYPSQATISKNAEKYNYCQKQEDCEVFLYRSGCIWNFIPINKENVGNMREEQRKWISSGTHGDCLAYRPSAEADCVNGKCSLIEMVK